MLLMGSRPIPWDKGNRGRCGLRKKRIDGALRACTSREGGPATRNAQLRCSAFAFLGLRAWSLTLTCPWKAKAPQRGALRVAEKED